MTLMLAPQLGQTIVQSNFSATPSTTTPGSLITAGSANVKGAWTELIAATDNNSYGFNLVIMMGATASAARNWLMDIGIGAAAAEVVLVPDFLGTASINSHIELFIPIFIPKGTRIAARGQCTTGSATNYVQVFTVPTPLFPCFTGAVSIGSDTAASNGVALTPGATGTESSWVSVGGTTARELSAFTPVFGTGTQTAYNLLAVHIEWGYSSTTLGERYASASSSESLGTNHSSLPDMMTVPSGTQLQMRGESSNAGEAMQVMLLGYY